MRLARHDSGYFCVTGAALPGHDQVLDLPLGQVADLLEGAEKKTPGAPSRAALPADGGAVRPGAQDQWLHARAGKYRREGAEEQEIVEHLLVDMRRCPAAGAPWTRADAERHARQVMRHAPAELALDPKDPFTVAQRYLAETSDGGAVLCQAGLFYRWSRADNCWLELEDAVVRGEVWKMLAAAKRLNKDGLPVAFQPSQRTVGEVVDAARGISVYGKRNAPPCWLDGRAAGGIISFRNGNLTVEGRALAEPTAELYNHTALPFDWQPGVGAPEEWFRFLDSLWPGGRASEEAQLLQEMMGYVISGETRLQKILMVVGPKRSGKGTIGRILTQLVGQRAVAGPTLESLKDTFGRECLIGKSLALISDARITGQDAPKVVEELLSVSGEDTRSIQRKYLPPWDAKLGVRFLVLTNELPRIEDASGALASRFVVLRMTESFFGREDLALQGRVERELPEVLAWCLEGWDRLRARGHFVQPRASLELVREFEDLGSPIGTFVKERCVVGAGCEAERGALWREWLDWCEEQGRNYTGTLATFGRDLRAYVPGLGEHRRGQGASRTRTWSGVGLAAADRGREIPF